MATLKGVVTNAGTLVNEAQVSVFPTGTTNLKGQDTSGPSDGSYSISKLESGATYDVTVTDSSGADLHTFSVTMGTSTTTNVNLDVSVATATTSTATSATTTTTGTSATSGTSETSSTSATSATSETSATSATSETSTTSVTSVTTATTATDSSTSTTVSGSTTATATTVTLAPDPAYQALRDLINVPAYSITAAVNLDEARQSSNLYTIGNYLLARVPESIANLNNMLTNNTQGRLNLVRKADLISRFNDRIQEILRKRAEDFNNEESVLKEVRRQFNLGTAPAPDVNREFPGLLRDFVGLCADDLMGVTPDQVEGRAGGVVFDPAEKEKFYNFLRRLKTSIIKLTESMSIAGTLGTQAVVHRWSEILRDSLDIINNIARGDYVGSDDTDQKHWVAVVVALNNGQTADIKPYLVHAREGGQLLDDTITAYSRIQASDALEQEDESFLKSFFHTPGNIFSSVPGAPPVSAATSAGAGTGAAPAPVGVTVVVRLKHNARLLRDNWPTNWS